MRIGTRRRLPPVTELTHSDTMTSWPSRINFGKLEAVQTDRRKKIGSMPPNNCDPALTPGDPALGDRRCPKCGIEMEPIDIEVEGLPLQELQLCPGCYLVTWSDQDGPHVRQGVPMKPGVNPSVLGPGELSPSEQGPSDRGPSKSRWPAGEPEEC